MKVWKRHKKPCYFDFAQVVGNFVRDLRILADHIESHGHIHEAKRTAAEIRVGAQLLDLALNFEGPAMPDEEHIGAEARSAWAKQYTEEEDKAWADAWAWVGENVRKWWD